ncbi:MAG: T9SS type A sorting domain-containing protein [Flavobacteriales bacterium]|nr:T9SS type A sorting domain-containing protein [Flavobacteriales bacterium]MCB9177877.1 T9SS type A sorting domain-containing protein [Flavobacteriales bacterium]HPF90364.1 T9SS type A sorting domain-containing protein [Flavobacteriales bacterium]
MSETLYRIEVFVTTCLSEPSDLQYILITVDDGEEITVPRIDIQDFPAMDVRRSSYRHEHDFSEVGWHTVHAMLANRGSGIVNIPNSIAQTLCVETSFIAGPGEPMNNGIRFSMPPYSIQVVDNTWIHDPGATDADGDSLHFEWVVPNGNSCQPIMGYQFPAATLSASVEPVNGIFTWQSPPFNGAFNLTVRGSEYRDGELIGEVIRDMTLCVTSVGTRMPEGEVIGSLEITPSITEGPIRISGLGPGPQHITVLDPLGRLVFDQWSNAATCSIDLASHPTGTYFVKVKEAAEAIRVGRATKR